MPFPSRFSLSKLLAAIVLLAISLGTQNHARAAVSLISFEATPLDGRVEISWETATEMDTSGFYVLSSSSQFGQYTRVSAFITATGSGLSGDSYSYLHVGLANGSTYYYKLEMVALNNSSEFSNPIFATPSMGTQTPTPTRTQVAGTTATLTPTPSYTPTTPADQSQGTPTESAYPGPEATATDSAYPGAATSPPAITDTPSANTTPQPTLSLSPTQPLTGSVQSSNLPGGPVATWIPQPTIAILLPKDPSVPTPAAVDARLSPVEVASAPAGFPWTRIGPLAFIAMIWVLLGGWFFLSLRQME